MNNEIKELNKELHNKYISCMIRVTKIVKGLIYYCDITKNYYILQDSMDGNRPYPCDITKEFKYGWIVDKGRASDLQWQRVSNIKLLNNTSIIEVW